MDTQNASHKFTLSLHKLVGQMIFFCGKKLTTLTIFQTIERDCRFSIHKKQRYGKLIVSCSWCYQPFNKFPYMSPLGFLRLHLYMMYCNPHPSPQYSTEQYIKHKHKPTALNMPWRDKIDESNCFTLKLTITSKYSVGIKRWHKCHNTLKYF